MNDPLDTQIARALDTPPHCETCRCTQTAQATWRRYSKTTTARKDCHRCKATAIMPGQAGWWWRYVPPKTRGYHIGRSTESLCAGCAGTLGLG